MTGVCEKLVALRGGGTRMQPWQAWRASLGSRMDGDCGVGAQIGRQGRGLPRRALLALALALAAWGGMTAPSRSMLTGAPRAQHAGASISSRKTMNTQSVCFLLGTSS